MEIENESYSVPADCLSPTRSLPRRYGQPNQSIPKGYKLVPESLTKEMKDAGRSVKIAYGLFDEDDPLETACSESEIEKIWTALLSAASK